MKFCLYPTLEYSCGNVSRCPHLDGAAIMSLVQIANHSGQTIEHLYRQLDAERERNSRLVNENLQEDIIDNVYRVMCYQHEATKCDDCGRHVQKVGEGEILGSRIGPELRSIAARLRNGIGITYRKVPQVIEELYGVSFTILGNDFTGTLVTDCYSGYFASVAGAKQKCLAHVARKA